MLFGIADGIVQQHDLAACTSVDQVAQDKLSDAAKAVEGDTGHEDQAFALASVPMASTRDCSDIRLSAFEGQLDEGHDPAAQGGVGLGKDKRLFGVRSRRLSPGLAGPNGR